CFFFSSRRRHTRFSRDWSSDVCSSDLAAAAPGRDAAARIRRASLVLLAGPEPAGRALSGHVADAAEQLPRAAVLRTNHAARRAEIGRASCRERGGNAVGGASCGATTGE